MKTTKGILRMPVSLNLLSAAAPLLVEAANAIFNKIRNKKGEQKLKDQEVDRDEKLSEIENRQNELYQINEEQSKILRDLAEQNQKLISAVRKTRMIAAAAFMIGIAAILIALL